MLQLQQSFCVEMMSWIYILLNHCIWRRDDHLRAVIFWSSYGFDGIGIFDEVHRTRISSAELVGQLDFFDFAWIFLRLTFLGFIFSGLFIAWELMGVQLLSSCVIHQFYDALQGEYLK